MGLTVQTFVVALQNAVERADLGVATATNQFARSIGGTLAVAAYGTLLVSRLGTELARHASAAAGKVDPGSLLRGSEAAGRLPAAAVHGVHVALAASLEWVFLGTLPLVAAAILASFLLQEVPLRTASHVELPAELDATDGRAIEQAV
jgi:hypothetical protein